jgi:NADP-dependent 3-hydroxy acid dehydrogenase YdfG
MSRVEGTVAIVTGGSGGAGLATARRFAAAGAKVLITGRRQDILEEVTANCPNMQGFVSDVAVAADAARTVARGSELWGSLSVLAKMKRQGIQSPSEPMRGSMVRILSRRAELPLSCSG